MDPDRLLARIRRGETQNVVFRDFVRLIRAFGFELERTESSHQIYSHPRVGLNLNVQPDRGQAKPYQLHELVRMIDRYALTRKER